MNEEKIKEAKANVQSAKQQLDKYKHDFDENDPANATLLNIFEQNYKNAQTNLELLEKSTKDQADAENAAGSHVVNSHEYMMGPNEQKGTIDTADGFIIELPKSDQDEEQHAEPKEDTLPPESVDYHPRMSDEEFQATPELSESAADQDDQVKVDRQHEAKEEERLEDIYDTDPGERPKKKVGTWKAMKIAAMQTLGLHTGNSSKESPAMPERPKYPDNTKPKPRDAFSHAMTREEYRRRMENKK